ncbi:MAG TPA: hypothetical protein VMC41_01455 [Candidatus Nanoarchaeia archaeon]|nr:hypothetical protein [Candidatus Nanoarchaeia archaeon]
METLITSGQKRTIKNLLRDGAEKYVEALSIGKDLAQNVIMRGGELRETVRAAIEKAIAELSGDPIAGWTQFYRDWLGLTVDLSGVVIPVNPGGLDWINIVAKELLEASNGRPHGFVIEAMRRKGISVRTYNGDLDAVLSPGISIVKNDLRKNDRWPDKASYAVRNRDRAEADEEYKNLSADDLAMRNILGSTFLERLLHGYRYFIKTGKHLDISNWTLCSGSRDSGGGVPGVSWDSGKVSVIWRHPSSAFDVLRSRFVAV